MKDRVVHELGVARAILKNRDIRMAGRMHLLILQARLVFGRHVKRDVKVKVRGGVLHMASDTARIDFETFQLMYLWVAFDADCEGQVVIDVGAHKGYFAAWALGRGATAVFSCEPQSQNFHYLELAQRDNWGRSRWMIRHAAVGLEEGTARLYVSPDSWAHSLYSDMIETDSYEDVEMTTLAALLEMSGERYPGVPVVLKVNVEGAAADVCYSASAEQLSLVTEVHLDHEEGSHYDLPDLLKYLEVAGLPVVLEKGGHNYLLRRQAQIV